MSTGQEKADQIKARAQVSLITASGSSAGRGQRCTPAADNEHEMLEPGVSRLRGLLCPPLWVRVPSPLMGTQDWVGVSAHVPSVCPSPGLGASGRAPSTCVHIPLANAASRPPDRAGLCETPVQTKGRDQAGLRNSSGMSAHARRGREKPRIPGREQAGPSPAGSGDMALPGARSPIGTQGPEGQAAPEPARAPATAPCPFLLPSHFGGAHETPRKSITCLTLGQKASIPAACELTLEENTQKRNQEKNIKTAFTTKMKILKTFLQPLASAPALTVDTSALPRGSQGARCVRTGPPL